MQPFSATRADPHYHAGIHPALTSFADECCATLARLIAYVGALALLGIVGLHLWDELPAAATDRARRQAGLERGVALAPGLRRQLA